MRFGRAPHNIMHFGKRSGETSDLENAAMIDGDVDAFLSQPHQSRSVNIPQIDASSGHIVEIVSSGSSNGPRYLVVQLDANPTPNQHTGNTGAGTIRLEKKAHGHRAMLPEESDNLFMHFGWERFLEWSRLLTNYINTKCDHKQKLYYH